MKLLILFLLVAFAISAFAQSKTSLPPKVKELKQAVTKPASPAKDSASRVKQEILKLEHEWALALLSEDAAKLETLLADNLQYTRSNGKVENKAGYLEPIKNGTTTYSLVKRDDVKVQVNGHTAIVTGRWKTRLQNKPNPPLETTARYLHVYMKQNGRWLLTAHQNTEIK